jgi:hypothetical protein
MAITYTWAITEMQVRNETIEGTTYDNTVVQTFWEKTGTDENGNTGMFAGATPFQYNPESSTFMGWIQAVVGSYEEHVNEQIQQEIDEKVNPIIDPGLPWAPAPE